MHTLNFNHNKWNKDYRTLQLFHSFDVRLQVLLPMPVPLLPISHVGCISLQPLWPVPLVLQHCLSQQQQQQLRFSVEEVVKQGHAVQAPHKLCTWHCKTCIYIYIYTYIHTYTYKTNSSKVDGYSSETRLTHNTIKITLILSNQINPYSSSIYKA